MAWLYLYIAGIFECVWVIALKHTAGFTRPLLSLFAFVTMIISVFLLSLSMRSISVGIAYAVWTGIGVVGVALVGAILFNESLKITKIICILLIIFSTIYLRILSE